MKKLIRVFSEAAESTFSSLRVFQLSFLFGVLCLVAASCASQPPLVADPPQHTHTPPELVPWEEEYARSRLRPEVFEEALSAKDEEQTNGELEQPSKESTGTLQVLVDVLAFPFRGVGWLLQQVF